MSLVALPEKTVNPSDASDFNNLRNAISGDIYPRNSSAMAEDVSADLGNSTYPWLRAAVANGYFAPGAIIPWYDYADLLDLPHGYMLCDGSQITKENYNIQHRTGPTDTTDYWALYVGSSELENLYLPGGDGRFLMGQTATLADGISAIPEVGNASSLVSLAHDHGGTILSGFSPNILSTSGAGMKYNNTTFQHQHSFTVPSALTTVDVTPTSIDVKFLLRIVE